MRVGYYRYAGGRLNWGSQTTLTEPLSVWRNLFATAQAQPWFAALLPARGGAAQQADAADEGTSPEKVDTSG